MEKYTDQNEILIQLQVSHKIAAPVTAPGCIPPSAHGEGGIGLQEDGASAYTVAKLY